VPGTTGTRPFQNKEGIMKRWATMVVAAIVIAVFSLPNLGICSSVVPFTISKSRPIISDDAPHYLLWHDGDTWHLRWQSPEDKARFTGELKVSGGSISLVKRVNLEKKDKTREKESAITFKGKVKEQPEGFDFRWTGSKLWVDLYIEDEHRPSKIYIGRRARRPSVIPFYMEGTASRTAKGEILSSVALGLPDITTSKPHYFVWHDGDSWHIRWCSPEKKMRFSGTIKAINGSMELMRRVNLEKKDKTKVHAPDTITFKGKVKEQPEGFDFRWTGSKLMLDLSIDGEHHPEEIYIGRHSVVPEKTPFYVVPGRYVLPTGFPLPHHRNVNSPPPRNLPPPFRHIRPPLR